MIRAITVFLFLCGLAVGNVVGQSPNIPLNKDYYHLLDRYEVLSGKQFSGIHSTAKPYRRESIAAFIDGLESDSLELSGVDAFNLDYLATDNWSYSEKAQPESRRRFLKVFYERKNDFYSLKTKEFELHVNPVFHFSGGFDRDQEVTPYINTRGLEISGRIAEKIGYYTYLSTTQAAFPSYARSWIDRNGAVPQEGFYKIFNKDGYDFFTARGYFDFNIVKPLNLQFGHDKLFLGNGIRSMALSDFSNNYLFLKLNLNVWKLNYRYTVAQHYATTDRLFGSPPLYEGYPRKYFAHHHISMNIGKNLNIGFFEHIIQGDSTDQSFDLNYLNPIIFFRGLEHQSASKDNAIVGFDVKYNFLRHFSLYGQFLLDEFLLDEVRAGNGWWANKYGAQIGLKYFDILGLRNLDMNLEYNVARPYTYAHATIYTNFAHYRMPLAHPLGGNFREFISIVRYQPFNRISLTAKMVLSGFGDDDGSSNWGKNVMKSYNSREQDYGNEIGQGYKTDLRHFDFTASYQFKFNVFVDLQLTVRKTASELPELEDNTLYTSIHFRWNIPKRDFDF